MFVEHRIRAVLDDPAAGGELLELLIPEQVAHLVQDDAAHLFRLIVARHSD